MRAQAAKAARRPSGMRSDRRLPRPVVRIIAKRTMQRIDRMAEKNAHALEQPNLDAHESHADEHEVKGAARGQPRTDVAEGRA